MKRLSVEQFGTDVQGVRLRGNPKNPEPESFRVRIPFGEVDITRCTDGSYWVHVQVNDAEQIKGHDDPSMRMGRLIDGRIDVVGKHTSDVNHGDFENPNTYHVAVRIGAKDGAS